MRERLKWVKEELLLRTQEEREDWMQVVIGSPKLFDGSGGYYFSVDNTKVLTEKGVI